MKALFIYPDIGSFLPPHFQHGIGFLSAALRKNGHQAGLFYLSELWPREKIIQATKDYAPGLVCLSGTSHQYRYIEQIAGWLKAEMPEVPVACGGVHAMLASDEVIRNPAIDIVCLGEGEAAIVELAQALDQGKDYYQIQNLWVKNKGEVVRNPLRPLQENLDALPFPDRELFNHQEILDRDGQRLSLLVGRGCPYGCTYCANQAKRDLFKGLGKYVRLRSVENLLSEIQLCAEKYQVRSLDFNDDIFTLNRSWMQEFFEKYPKRFSYPFRINVHAGTVDQETFERLASAGCEMVRIGVESGSERVRKKIMNRSIKEDEIVQSFAWAESAKIKTWSFNMVGLPGESAEDALDTYNLNRALFPDHMQVSVFNPYPGTKLFDLCKDQGLIKGALGDGYFVPQSVLEFGSLSPAEIHNWHQRLVRLSEVCRNEKKLRRDLAGRKIFYNLMDELYRAKIETPVPDYYGEEQIIIYEEARRALIMHPPCKITYQLGGCAAPELRFGIMMHPGIYETGEPGGVRFVVKAGKTGTPLKEIFTHELNAKTEKSDRGFFDFEVDLSEFSAGSFMLELSTAPKNPEQNQFNTAGFTNPVIVSRKTGESSSPEPRSETCSAQRP
jgi:anaerobic magnesium-protoporphyrin IX monomethyl ester cyclase